jgi:hypothetical protein
MLAGGTLVWENVEMTWVWEQGFEDTNVPEELGTMTGQVPLFRFCIGLPTVVIVIVLAIAGCAGNTGRATAIKSAQRAGRNERIAN